MEREKIYTYNPTSNEIILQRQNKKLSKEKFRQFIAFRPVVKETFKPSQEERKLHKWKTEIYIKKGRLSRKE